MTLEDAHLVDRNRDLYGWLRWSVEVGKNCTRHSAADSPPSGAVIAVKYTPKVNWISVIRANPKVIVWFPPVTAFILFDPASISTEPPYVWNDEPEC